MPPRWRRQLKHLRCASGIVLSPVEVDVRDVQGHVQVAVAVAVIQHALVLAEGYVLVDVEIFVFMVTNIDNQLL